PAAGIAERATVVQRPQQRPTTADHLAAGPWCRALVTARRDDATAAGNERAAAVARLRRTALAASPRVG
ncbi:MAG TPA: hypothetical protein VKC57_14720, partial [Ktedonobacterales bacterium]|nr:hypothetical protein [Ktedonobacterales bacterium]